MQARNIDEVVHLMDQIIDHSITRGQRLAYFTALYRLVTLVVRQACDDNHFEDNDRMRELDTIFANRYFEAVAVHQAGREPTASWAVAFQATEVPHLLIMQHLLLGMNAHINLDLGISAAEISGGVLSPGLRRDFDKLNDILASLIDIVQDQIGLVSPWFGTLERATWRADELLVNFSINTARDGAWRFAERLIQTPGAEREGCILARDAQVARLGHHIARTSFPLAALVRVISLREEKDIRRVIAALGNTDWRRTLEYHVDDLRAAAAQMGIELPRSARDL
ncbi:MAG: DUF5995 family protein [Anaerolineales bacterium]